MEIGTFSVFRDKKKNKKPTKTRTNRYVMYTQYSLCIYNITCINVISVCSTVRTNALGIFFFRLRAPNYIYIVHTVQSGSVGRIFPLSSPAVVVHYTVTNIPIYTLSSYTAEAGGLRIRHDAIIRRGCCIMPLWIIILFYRDEKAYANTIFYVLRHNIVIRDLRGIE